ncbi:hypothetical protein [Legionella shakespearei]|uniref:Uncharacterized protein n=1 Tax=Legionella shakespearei DSM 23087 TaxID=1122169 RepID=A0A0W0Z2M0_9GAMM|nr:hypothetical protein [Legionella shakespearei]KTD63119.1 hypothetical protein Lsha_0805 [Legionella shakespearei DSM 23087]
MQSKFEKFNELPSELKIKIAQNLSKYGFRSLAETSKYSLALFKPMIDVRKLLHYVTRGEHDAVKAMLKQNISLIFKRDIVTDCSGRKFENVSAFEYALWALDKHMWAAMIDCIPSNEEGKKVFARLIAQYNKVNTEGCTYSLNGKTITEKHFDFENTIIKELRTQVDLQNAPGVKDWDALGKQWREGVGGAQKLLPMHVVDEYCSSDVSFCLGPQFISQPKSSKQFYARATESAEHWFSLTSKLSVDFAIHKDTLSTPRSAYKATGGALPLGCIDVGALTTLYKVRKNDFIALKSQLEDQMRPDNHHQVSQIFAN